MKRQSDDFPSALLLFAVDAETRPRDRSQARFGDRFLAHLANAVGPSRDPSKGVLDGAQEPAISLLQADLHCGLACGTGLVSGITVQMSCRRGKSFPSPGRCQQLLPFGQQKLLISLQFFLVHFDFRLFK